MENGLHSKGGHIWDNIQAKVTQSFTEIRKINARLQTKNNNN